ncbi:predicted protein [Histoplasma mississippiense (nom. inval.)]|uniref:predicted protein n=1 Tax=Ajellomyces capsulatus (strain NAm1 / WU24) TaxID=2059318 RepID=UPI000157B93E|nr:predicted protein [Histoplasma mississippiense (nom. inval.)]EDN03997.1 predicted protein [Histoplasma mississippiense (nom. inval.)]
MFPLSLNTKHPTRQRGGSLAMDIVSPCATKVITMRLVNGPKINLPSTVGLVFQTQQPRLRHAGNERTIPKSFRPLSGDAIGECTQILLCACLKRSLKRNTQDSYVNPHETLVMATFPAGLETPLLKVSRPVAACSRCRAAKVKCDGKLPACSACERAGKASSCPGATDDSVNATSRDFYGITSSTSFARLLVAVAVSKPLQNAGVNRGLPARPVSSTLIQHYFDNIYVLAPFFIQTNFWASFDAIYQEGGRFAKSFDYWIVHMVLAISQALTSHSQIARHHVSMALEYADDVLHPGSIAGIQAILLLAQYSMLDPEHFRTWHLIGSAARVVSDLGIHQEQLSEPYLNKTNLDLRRKVFHCVYSFDRYVSIAFGRAFSFSDDSVNVPLPGVPLQPIGEALNWTTPLFAKGIEPAIYLFKIRGIQSKAYQIMFFSGRNPAPEPSLYTWEVCAEAQNWFNAIPRTLPGHLIIFYNAELFFTFVILLSPSNYNPSVSTLHRVLLFEYAIKFISQIHQIISAASWPLFFSYIDIQRVYTVASKLIDALDQSYNEILLDTLPELATPLPPGTHQPPYVSPTERIDSNGRALKCLQSIGSILKYAHTSEYERSAG